MAGAATTGVATLVAGIAATFAWWQCADQVLQVNIAEQQQVVNR